MSRRGFLQRLRSWTGALLAPSWLPARRGLGGVIRESSTGAWQRNLRCDDPTLLAFSAVYACVTIISGDVSKLGLYLYRRKEDGTRELATQHPIAGVLRRPNDYQTQLEFMQCVMLSTLAAGNAYLLKRRDERGVISALYPLDPRNVQPVVLPDGTIQYALGGDLRLTGFDAGDQVIAPSREIIHHRINPFAHPLLGTSPLMAAALSATVGLNITENSAALFGNLSRPGGIITAPKPMSQEHVDRVRARWEQMYGGQNIGRVAILADGLKFESAGFVNAVDAQLIDQLRWSVEDVARVFRVPGFMLGDLSKVTYRNSEQLQRTYYSGCLQFHLEALEARLHEGLELKDDHFVEFDLDNLLRTEMDVRFESYQKAINSGFYSINDARRREDLSPVKGGDEPLVQAQYRPLSAAIAEAEAAVEKAKREAAAPPPEPAPAANEPAAGDAEEEARALTLRLTEGLSRYVRAA